MKKIISLVIILCGFAAFVQAQDRRVKILRLEIDKKEIKSDFRVFFYEGKKRIIPIREGNSFIVPSNFPNQAVTVQILFKNYDLVFYPIYPSKFETDWIVGIDKKPFDSENVSIEESKNVKIVYYLQFVSNKGDDTRLVITINKKAKK